MSNSKRPQPHNLEFGAASKVHVRGLRLGGHNWRVVTLRPGTRALWSTNFFHETWHIVSDTRGSRTLARLLWGLAFQKMERTLIVLHGEHLAPTPFEAEPSDPIVLLNSRLAPMESKTLSELKGHLSKLGAPECSARWQSWGLDRTLEEEERSGDRWAMFEQTWWKSNKYLWQQEQMARVGGCVCYIAPPPILQFQAMCLSHMKARPGKPSDETAFHYLAYDHKRNYIPDGEVQIFCDYRSQLSRALVARRQVLGEVTQESREPFSDIEFERAAIHDRVLEIKRQEQNR